MFPYRSPLGVVGSYVALAILIIIILTKSFDVFILSFDYKSFIVGYIGIPVYLIFIFGYKFWFGTRRVKSSEADLTTGVPEMTVSEERAKHQAALLAAETEQTGFAGRVAFFYRKVFSWLF